MQNKKPFDALLAKKHLDIEFSQESRLMKFYKEVICTYYGKPLTYLDVQTRKHEFVKIRQVCMYLIRKMLKYGYTRIANEFKKDHATIIYSCRLLEGYLEYDKDLLREIEDLQKILTLKTKANIKGIDLDGDYYYIDMNKCSSIKISKDKAIVFVGFSDKEVKNMKVSDSTDNFIWIDSTNEIRNHENTAIYILEDIDKPQTETNGKENEREEA